MISICKINNLHQILIKMQKLKIIADYFWWKFGEVECFADRNHFVLKETQSQIQQRHPNNIKYADLSGNLDEVRLFSIFIVFKTINETILIKFVSTLFWKNGVLFGEYKMLLKTLFWCWKNLCFKYFIVYKTF